MPQNRAGVCDAGLGLQTTPNLRTMSIQDAAPNPFGESQSTQLVKIRQDLSCVAVNYEVSNSTGHKGRTSTEFPDLGVGGGAASRAARLL